MPRKGKQQKQPKAASQPRPQHQGTRKGPTPGGLGTAISSISAPSAAPNLRRSLRLKKLHDKNQEKAENIRRDNSPHRTNPSHKTVGPTPGQPVADKPASLKPGSPALHRTEGSPGRIHDDPVATWAATSYWPEDFAELRPEMGGNKAVAKVPAKRKASGSHYTTFQARMAQHGVLMRIARSVHPDSKEMCQKLLQGSRKPTFYPSYPAEMFLEVLDRAVEMNETQLQRDITPIIVPSASNLVFSGRTDFKDIGDEVDQLWSCRPLGSELPKPHYTAGIRPEAFTVQEIGKLQAYSSFETPSFFTHQLYFPFLICEAKISPVGMQKAEQQVIHSCSIAVRAIIELHKKAYGKSDDRVRNLYRKILVFSICHDSGQVGLYGHFARESAESGDKLEFLHYEIGRTSLKSGEDQELFKPYNFVCNLYESFFPDHLQRIKEALSAMPAISPSADVTLGVSNRLENQSDSQESEQEEDMIICSQADTRFKMPGAPASAMRERTVAPSERTSQIVKQVEGQVVKQMEKRVEKVENRVEKKVEKGVEKGLEKMAEQMEEKLAKQMMETEKRNEEKEKLVKE